MTSLAARILVQLGAGVGNVVLATPLLIALDELGFTLDVLLAADYSETQELLQPWSVVRKVFHSASRVSVTSYDRIAPALPPYYQARFGRALANRPNAIARPTAALFYSNEQEFYLHFARSLDYPARRTLRPSLPIAPSEKYEVSTSAVVIAPGCKTGVMATKRWPYFPQLAEAFDDVVIVGTTDDLTQSDGAPMKFPSHVRSLVGQLSLRETAEVMAAAGVVVGNDSGLSHVAAAVGVPTVMIFGPTPHETLGPMAPNVKVLRSGLPCEPCWFRERFVACGKKMDCLCTLPLQRVVREVSACLA
jgi:ADP-heptose:LPS heptosyltransferase